MDDSIYDIKKIIVIRYLQREHKKHRLGLFCMFYSLDWNISELREELDKKDITQDKLETIYKLLKL